MKRFFATVLALAMTLSLAACGGSSGKPTGGTSGSGSGTGGGKDTLIIGHYGDTPNFDTHNNLNDNGMRINMSLYDPLVRMDNTTYEIHPCIAEKWTVSEDGTEYTFKIKQGVKFSDGSDMKLSDVVFSLQRGMEMPMAVPSFARVVGVEPVGDDSVLIKLDGPYPEFLFAMSLPTAGILSEKACTEMGDDFAKNPVTTGPYMVKEWKAGEKVVLEANPHYHMGTPPIKTVEYRVIADQNAAVISLEAGDIDAYVDVQQSSFKRIQEDKNLELHIGQAFGFSYVQLNCAKFPFDNIKARQAMAYAVDKEAILYGIMDGDGSIVDTFAQPEYLGYTDDVVKYPYDPEKAKQLFAEAGVKEGTELSISVYTVKASKVAQVLQNSLEEMGFKVSIDQMERSAFDDAALNGNTQIICDGATFTAPTIDEATYSAVHSSQMDVRNYSKYSNPAMDKLLDDARVATSNDQRAALYQNFLKLMSEECPLIPTVWNTKNIAAKKDLQGVTANPWSFYNVYDFSWS